MRSNDLGRVWLAAAAQDLQLRIPTIAPACDGDKSIRVAGTVLLSASPDRGSMLGG
jgi:hypothetical protein